MCRSGVEPKRSLRSKRQSGRKGYLQRPGPDLERYLRPRNWTRRPPTIRVDTITGREDGRSGARRVERSNENTTATPTKDETKNRAVDKSAVQAKRGSEMVRTVRGSQGALSPAMDSRMGHAVEAELPQALLQPHQGRGYGGVSDAVRSDGAKLLAGVRRSAWDRKAMRV